MAVAKVLRIALYSIQWIWTVVILGIVPNQLVIKNQALDSPSGGTGSLCALNWSLGLSRCNFAVAWAAIAFAILSVAIAWYFLDSIVGSVGFPYNVEMVIFCWLSLWWFVGAITISAVKAGNAPRGANVVLAFAWMLVFFPIGSAVLAVKSAQPFGKKANRSIENSVNNEEDERSAESIEGDEYA